MNSKSAHSRHRLALAVLAACMGAAHAQTSSPPNIGDALRQVQPVAPPTPPAPPVPAIGGVPLEPPMQRLPDGGPAVQVDAIEITGNRVIDTPTLQGLVTADAGKRYTLAQIEDIASRITRYYRSRGFFVARAYVPQQEIVGGRLTLRVVEGNYGQFHLKNTSHVHDDVVQGLLDDIKDRDIVSLDTLERAMLIINDTPGVKVVSADVMPGEQVGTSDFAIGSEAAPAYDGFVLLDNYGSRYTGKDRLTFNADWNSPTGRGDRLSLTGLASNGGDLLNGRLGYSGLVATNGTRLEGAVSRTQYSLGNTYAALDATGTADSLELNLTTPWKRTRNASVELGASVALRDLDDKVRSTDTDTRKHAASVMAHVLSTRDDDWLGFAGQTRAMASVTVGDLRFQDATARALDAAGPRTQGAYGKLDLNLVRASLLPADFTLTTEVRAQHVLTGKNLDGSEKMEVSGVGAVAAYPQGELSGDNAVLLRGQLAHPLGQARDFAFSGNAFASWGHAGAAHAYPGSEARDLSDVGLGLDANGTRGALLKLIVAHRVSGGPAVSEPSASTRFLVQAGWQF